RVEDMSLTTDAWPNGQCRTWVTGGSAEDLRGRFRTAIAGMCMDATDGEPLQSSPDLTEANGTATELGWGQAEFDAEVDVARADAAEIGRQLDTARRGLKLLQAKREDERRRAIYLGQQRDLEASLGLPPPPPAQTQDERHAAEYAALVAQLEAATPEQVALMDPHSKQAKAAELQRLNEIDPSWRAKNGLPALPDALDILSGRVDPARDAAVRARDAELPTPGPDKFVA